jgi:4-hydroxy-4-methyl-2-oxoglutarate aldolase
MNTPDIIRDFLRLPTDLVARAASHQPAMFSDVGGRRGAMHGRISAIATTMKCAGSAFTVEVRPGDNLMIHAALALAKPGDVLVIDGKGDQMSALMGTLMLSAAKGIGLAGVVIDGAVRDVPEIIALGFPVFCVGSNPNGPGKVAPGRINHPISCGGVTVRPGDFVIADADGVVVVDAAQLAERIPLVEKKVADEQKRIAEIAAGQFKPKWLEASLRIAGVLGANETLP